MAGQPFTLAWNNNTWGLSDNKYQAPPGRFSEWFWIDIQNLYMQNSLSDTLTHTYPATIWGILNTAKIDWLNNNIIWLTNGSTYQNTTTRASFTVWQQWHIIEPMNVWGTFFLYYFASWGQIHRTNLDWTWINQSFRTYTWSGATQPNVSYNDWARILFSYNNILFQINNSQIVTTALDLPLWENIVWITRFQWQYRIYTSVPFVTSKIYTWDGVSSLPSSALDIHWIEIINVVNKWAYDLFNDRDKNLYKLWWVQYIKISQWITSSLLGVYKDFVYWNFISSWTNINVLGAYGQKPWYPEWINPLYWVSTVSNLSYWPNILAYTIWSNLYTVWWWNTAQTSYLTSLVFTGSNVQSLKLIDELILKFEWATATSQIKLEAELNNDWTFIHLWTWDNSSITTRNLWLRLTSNLFLNPLWNFNTIRFKVSILWDWVTTVKWYWLDLIGKQFIWK